MSRYVCQICGFVYDEAKGMPDRGIAPGTTWEQLPENWVCPLCGAPKSQFKKEIVAKTKTSQQMPATPAATGETAGETLRPMSDGELAAVLSNLARGCEKQYRAKEAALFAELSTFYTARAANAENGGVQQIKAALDEDIQTAYPSANAVADTGADRGAKRVLVWSEKVSRMTASILDRYEKEGSAAFENARIWVCDICGFIYIGDVPPAVCPVCKVPSMKILEVART